MYSYGKVHAKETTICNYDGLFLSASTSQIRQSTIWYAVFWLINEASDVPSIIIVFQNSFQNSLQKLIQFFFYFFHRFTKIKIESFECPKSIRNYEQNNVWNIRRMVDNSFIPANQRTSVSYCRLSDFTFTRMFTKTAHVKSFLKCLYLLFDGILKCVFF